MVSNTPTDGKCNYEYTPEDDYKHDSGFCESSPMDNGSCYHHGGKRQNGGAPAENDNAVTHAAYASSFVADYLTDEEIERVEQAQELLDTKAGAQNHARLVAAIALEQFRRTGDDRFMRRYESICDKAGIFPADELDVSGNLSVEQAFMENLKQANGHGED